MSIKGKAEDLLSGDLTAYLESEAIDALLAAPVGSPLVKKSKKANRGTGGNPASSKQEYLLSQLEIKLLGAVVNLPQTLTIQEAGAAIHNLKVQESSAPKRVVRFE